MAGWFLLLSFLPLDVALPSRAPGPAPAPLAPLRVEALLVGQRVSAQLVNDGPPVRLLLGYSCSGPETFHLVVDGEERRFTRGRDCDKNVERVIVLPTGGRSEPALSDVIVDLSRVRRLTVLYRGTDGGHACAGCFPGALRSPPLDLGKWVTH